MAKRKGISTRVRFEVFKRDRFTCQYCGQTPPAVILHVDHVIAVASGGTNQIDNLITACKDCNAGKSDIDLSAIPASVAANLVEARERADQLKAYTDFQLEQRQAQSDAVVRLGWYWFNKIMDEKDHWGFKEPEQQSIRTFLKRLTEAEVMDAMDIAHGRTPPTRSTGYWKHTWRYFCGVCWTVIREKGGDL